MVDLATQIEQKNGIRLTQAQKDFINQSYNIASGAANSAFQAQDDEQLRQIEAAKAAALMPQLPSELQNKSPIQSSASDLNQFLKTAPILSNIYALGSSVPTKTYTDLRSQFENNPVLSSIYAGGQAFEAQNTLQKISNERASELQKITPVFQKNYDTYLKNVDQFNAEIKQFNTNPSPSVKEFNALANKKAVLDAQQKVIESQKTAIDARVADINAAQKRYEQAASRLVNVNPDQLSLRKTGEFFGNLGVQYQETVEKPISERTAGVGTMGEFISGKGNTPGITSVPRQIASIAEAALVGGEIIKNNIPAVPGLVAAGLAMQAKGMYESAQESPIGLGGQLVGMHYASKGAGGILARQPFRYAEVNIPIVTPEGMPATRSVNKGFKPLLESKTVDGIETYNRAKAGVPKEFVPDIKSEAIPYYSSWKGIYLDKKIDLPFGKSIGAGYYEGKIPVIGITTQTGITKPTGIITGASSMERFGAGIQPRIAGAIDFLKEEKPGTAALKLRAIKQYLPKEDVAAVQSIIDIRNYTTKYPNLITLKEEFGKITPTSMKPETYKAILEYINNNKKDMRLYGSLVGRAYSGSGGRVSLGDVDALIKSKVAQKHADAMWKIYLDNEYGKNNYNIKIETETTIQRTGGIIPKDKLVKEITQTATDKKTGEFLSKLEVKPSQLTGTRLTGTTKNPNTHALDLHPATNLKYTTVLPGADVATIPISDLIWGKQTIGRPVPIGAVSIDKKGGTNVVMEAGDRIKDLFDTYAFARVGAADAYLNPKIPLEVGQKLEAASDVLRARLDIAAKTKKQVKQFLGEMVDPLSSQEVKAAKLERLNPRVQGRMYSGVPIGEDYYSGYISPSDRSGNGIGSYIITTGLFRNKSYQYAPSTKKAYAPTEYYSGLYSEARYTPSAYSTKPSEYKPSGYYNPKLGVVASVLGSAYTPKSNEYSPSKYTEYDPTKTSVYTPSMNKPYGTSQPRPYGTPAPKTYAPYSPKTPYSPKPPYVPETPYTPKTPYVPPQQPPYAPPPPPPYAPKTPPYTTSTITSIFKSEKRIYTTTKKRKVKKRKGVYTEPSHWELGAGAEPGDVLSFIFGGGVRESVTTTAAKKKGRDETVSALSSGLFSR